jgi:NADPH-dependent curcumin reductase CurA
VGWIREGRLRYREDMLKGMEAAPGSIKTLYSGANSGKLVIRL